MCISIERFKMKKKIEKALRREYTFALFEDIQASTSSVIIYHIIKDKIASQTEQFRSMSASYKDWLFLQKRRPTI